MRDDDETHFLHEDGLALKGNNATTIDLTDSYNKAIEGKSPEEAKQILNDIIEILTRK
jgi:hypothetical protein